MRETAAARAAKLKEMVIFARQKVAKIIFRVLMKSSFENSFLGLNDDCERFSLKTALKQSSL